MFPVETLGHEWMLEGAERSGALGAKRRVVRTGSRGTIDSTGKLIECLGRNGTKCNGGRSLILVPRKAVSLKCEPLLFNSTVARDGYNPSNREVGH